MTFQLPQGFKVGDAFQALNATAQDDNLADGIGQGYGVIGYKGKTWTLRYRGKVYQFIRPDDGTSLSYIDAIILGNPPNKSKSYYPAYVPGQSDGERPICASMDSVTPDNGVTTKQSETCALCPRNEWKTDAKTGRKSRECTDYKRLAVLLMPALSKAMLGSELLEPVFLRIPPDSLQALATMGDGMAKQGLHYSSYVTRISFDQQKAHPSMIFQPQQGLTNEEAPVILDMRQDPLVDRIIHGDASIVGLAAVRNALAPPGTVPTGLVPARVAPQLPSPAPAAVANTVAAPTGVQQGAVDMAYANMAAGATASYVAPVQHVNPTQEVKSAPVTQSDTGNVELSDADLDAKLAAMIKNNKYN